MARRIVIPLLGIVLCLVLAIAWVRLAPSDPAQWHQMQAEIQARDFGKGAIRIVDGDQGKLTRLNAIVLATPRTRVFAGSVADGFITYVTRTARVGFPDYTTIRLHDGRIEILGRARYGLSDLGVNAARIDTWLEVLAQG